MINENLVDQIYVCAGSAKLAATACLAASVALVCMVQSQRGPCLGLGHAQVSSARVGWTAANVAFMRSGGYRLSARVRGVAQRTLLLWGRHDEIVDPMFAQRYLQDLPDCRCARAAQP